MNEYFFVNRLCTILLVKLIAKVNIRDFLMGKKGKIELFLGDRDPKHRAEEIIRICDVTGNKKLTKEEVS